MFWQTKKYPKPKKKECAGSGSQLTHMAPFCQLPKWKVGITKGPLSA